MTHAVHGAAPAHTKSPISVLYVVLASLLIGIGLACATLWLTYFNWWLFLGFLPLTLGALMLFSRRAGFDRADDPAFV